MNEPTELDEAYLIWLYSQVAKVKLTPSSRTYWVLFRQMYTTEFVWFVPNDDNRVADGKDLRTEFILDADIIDVDYNWMELGCSVLEMMIGLARRLAFQAEGQTDIWFWHLIENLDLMYNDFDPDYSVEAVNKTLEMMIWRTYLPNGTGGLFPLRNPERDQTEVELWDQLCDYILENT